MRTYPEVGLSLLVQESTSLYRSIELKGVTRKMAYLYLDLLSNAYCIETVAREVVKAKDSGVGKYIG